MRCDAAGDTLLKMPHPHRRNVAAPVAAACCAVWLALVLLGSHSCLAHSAAGGALDAAAGAFHWNWTVFWSVDPPPKLEFLPEDEDFIRVARPGAKSAAHKPATATTTRRRILWIPPEDGRSSAETDSAGTTVATGRRRRAVEKPVVQDRRLQDWLGIPGPPSGNQAFDGQALSDVAGEATSTSLRRSKSFPEQEQSDGMLTEVSSVNRGRERRSQDAVHTDTSENLSLSARGTKSPTLPTADNPSASPVSRSPISKKRRETEKIFKAVHEGVPRTVKSLNLGMKRRIRSQFDNSRRYPVHDGSDIAADRHRKWHIPLTLQSTLTENNLSAVSRNLKDEDRSYHKMIGPKRRLLWFQEGQAENGRSSFRYREDSKSNTASGLSEISQNNNILNQYASTIPAADLYKEKENLSNGGYLKLMRRSISPGKDYEKLINTLLKKVSEKPKDVTKNRERKLQDLPTLDGTGIPHTTRRRRSPTRTINSLAKSSSRRETEDSTMPKQAELQEIKDSLSLPVANSTIEQYTISKSSSRTQRSLDSGFIGKQENHAGLATSNDANQGTEKQRRIGRRLLGISSDGAVRTPAEDMGAVNEADREMTKEEEAAVRDQVVHDTLGDLLGVDGSGDGSGWGQADT